jgi:hypothetical protein
MPSGWGLGLKAAEIARVDESRIRRNRRFSQAPTGEKSARELCHSSLALHLVLTNVDP